MSLSQISTDALAAQLDQAIPANRRLVSVGASDPLVRAAALLARAKPPELAHVATANIERDMLAAFDRLHRQPFAPKTNKRLPSSHPSPVVWALAACIALVLFVAVIINAVSISLPGDVFYPAKRAIESVELGLAPDAFARAQVHLEHARRRADEAERMTRGGRSPEQPLRDAAQSLRDVLSLRGTDPVSIDEVEVVERQLAQTLSRAAATLLLDEFTSDTLESVISVTTLTVDPQPEPMVIAPQLMPTETPTSTPTTATPTFTVTYTATATSTSTSTPTPTSTPTATPTFTSTAAPSIVPTQSSNGQGANHNCQGRGNSCNSSGVPGGQVDPNNPPGQNGGRNDNPPQPPGQGNPRGGRP